MLGDSGAGSDSGSDSSSDSDHGSGLVVDSFGGYMWVQKAKVVVRRRAKCGDTQKEKEIISYLYSLYLAKSFKDHLVLAVLWLLARFLGLTLGVVGMVRSTESRWSWSEEEDTRIWWGCGCTSTRYILCTHQNLSISYTLKQSA